jgi:hypothetical protein
MGGPPRLPLGASTRGPPRKKGWRGMAIEPMEEGGRWRDLGNNLSLITPYLSLAVGGRGSSSRVPVRAGSGRALEIPSGTP